MTSENNLENNQTVYHTETQTLRMFINLSKNSNYIK